jgi:hypothetical protein
MPLISATATTLVKGAGVTVVKRWIRSVPVRLAVCRKLHRGNWVQVDEPRLQKNDIQFFFNRLRSLKHCFNSSFSSQRLMKSHPIFSALGILLVFVAAPSWARAASLPEAQKIDEILGRHWQKQGVTPNEAAPDEVFLRRIYVDVVGRIPTVEEAEAFLRSQVPDKRARLIDSLLASPGYASHFFNYYADLLRLLTDNKDSLTGQAYAQWLKEALQANKPYDVMVRELLTTEGGAWDSGAIGFYMRDRGMPLDHLAATVQVFLGTRIECAQCHNHPFDKWTQMDYYKMAAFTYGMDTRANYGFKPKDLAPGGKGKRAKNTNPETREAMQMVKQSLGEVMKPLRYTQIASTDKLPTLPHDYQYADGKPEETVEPATMFGHAAEVKEGETRLDAFARWMTSPENPRFTTVIANRLWKRIMGAGLIEPVDELMDSTVPVNAELMSYLEQLMVEKGYNLKSFLRVILNSDVYQRMPSTQGLALGETYHFPGPLMRRMSAEQVWDSVVTLIYGNVDEQSIAPNEANATRLATLENLYKTISGKTAEELVASAKAAKEGSAGNIDKKIKELTKAAAEARQQGDTAKAKALSGQVNRLRRDVRDNAFVAILGEEGAASFDEEMKMAGKNQKPKAKQAMAQKGISRQEVQKLLAQGMTKEQIRKQLQETRQGGRQAGQMMGQASRASDLPSPAPRGHFLRTFGQSDRETIENANREASVPQALNLLNGPVAGALLNSSSAFATRLAQGARVEDKMDSIYLALLTRHPTSNERQMLLEVAAERGETVVADVVHAVLNTGEFLFVR